MTRSLLRVAAFASLLALTVVVGGCLGGSSGDPSDAGNQDTGPVIVPPQAFHQTPRTGTYISWNYESILFEGLVILNTAGNDFSPFRATWFDVTAGVDLCKADGKQGPSCRINPAGEVSLEYPGEGVPLLDTGAHDIVFRIYRADSPEGQYLTLDEDPLTLNVTIPPEVPEAVYLTWEPSAGPAPISSDTIRLVVDLTQLGSVAAGDQVTFDIDWHRDPPLPAERRFTDVPACPAQGEVPTSCRLPKDDVCVGDTWWASVTVHNTQGEAVDTVDTEHVEVANVAPSCRSTDASSATPCQIGVRSGQGVRAQFRCTINCTDIDNQSTGCDDQSIHYHFDWLQPGVSPTDAIDAADVVDLGEATLQGRAPEDAPAMGTALAKGPLVCTVYAENESLEGADITGLRRHQCTTTVFNLQPNLGRSCIGAYNADFPGFFDQNTVYTCEPDRTTLTDPDDDAEDPSLFVYEYEWQRTPLGGNPAPLQIDNPDLATYPYHCGVDGEESGLARGDTLCCKATPRNPDTNSVTPRGTGHYGEGDECCVTVGNTPPVFRLPPTAQAERISDGTVRTTATEETNIRCKVADGAYFDCDGDRPADFRFQWSVQIEGSGEFPLFPNGQDIQTTGVIDPTNFNKGDRICCAALPNDGFGLGLPRRAESCIRVVNTAPTVTALRVQPQSAPKSEPFTCVGTWADPDPQDNLPGRIEQTWSFVVTKASGSSIEVTDQNGDGMLNPGESPQALEQGDRIHCCLIVSDGEDESPRMCSDRDFASPPGIVNDGIARIDGVQLVVTDGPDPPTVESTLQCRPYGWVDNESDPEGYQFRWYVNDELVLRDPTGPGAKLRSSLTAPAFSKGDLVTCRVVTFDGTNVSGRFDDQENPGLIWSESLTIADACWEVDQVLVTPSEGRNAGTAIFRCQFTGFTDPDPEDQLNPPALGYRWFQTEDPLSDLGPPVLGPGGLEVATQAITGDLLVPNTNARLVCAVLRECAGDMIVSSNGAQVINTCPRLTGASLAFTNENPDERPLVGDVVTCTPAGWNDQEGEEPRYRYEWRLNGAPIPDQTAATLTVVGSMAHQSLSCGAAPVDSHNEDCTLYLAPSMVIDNTPPSIRTVVYAPSELYTTTDVVCVPDGWTDPDGDRAGYDFEWLVDGAPVSPDLTSTTTSTDDTLSSAAFRKGQRVLCRATPRDGFDAGPTVQDVQLTVRNTLPTIAVAFDENAPNPERSENLVCRFTAEDPDDDNVTGTFRWYLNGALQNLTQTADLDDDPAVFELDITQFQPCDRFTCEVIPNDGEANGLADQDEAQYWGGAALSLSTTNAVVRPPVDGLLPATGTIDWWFRLESGAAGIERTLFAHKPSGASGDHVSVVIAADGSAGLRLGTTQIASVPVSIPIGHWVYYALQWNAGSWELFVHIRAADDASGEWYKVTKSGVAVSAWQPAALHFGAGSALEAAPVGVIDEIRFSTVRRWDPTRGVPFLDGLPVDAPRSFWIPLQGDAFTAALYHITSQGWSDDNTAPLTDWTPGGDTPATYDSAIWTRRSQKNECQFLLNVPPPPPKVALRIASIAPLPNPPQNPGYFMRWTVGCDLSEASVDFNGDPVGYVFRLFVEGTEIEAQTLDAQDVAQGANGVTFSEIVQFNHTTYDTPCPVVTCSVEAFDGELYSAPGEQQKIMGYVKIDDLQDPAVLNGSFARLGFGCQLGNVCLTNTCISDLGGCVFTPKPGPCSDGDACTSGDQCLDGVCVGSDRCEDQNQCTGHTCTVVAGVAVCQYENLTGPCADGDVCTVGDRCMDGLCVPGYQQDCDDNRACTRDSCDPVDGCVNDAGAVDGTRCENANLCTLNSQCQGGNCVGGATVPVNDDNQCTIDGCDPATGVYHTPKVGDVCDLTDPCVENERCRLVGVSVACVGEEKNCNDNNVCTSDGCDSSLPNGCFHLPNVLSCNDLNPCTIGDTCASGTCQPGTTQLVCNDGNPCTTDVCEYRVGCRFNYNNDLCNDANNCTQNDRCQVGQCVGTAISCDDNNPCTLDYCDAVQGCVYINTVDACNDGNECTTDDRCNAGVCGGTTVACNDGNPCTTDTCDGNIGCVFTNNNATCTDGNPCTLGDHCVQGACVAGVPRDCNDNNVCTFDTCSAAGNCEHIAQPGACEDGNLCTLDDQCAAGVCGAGATKNCDDEEFCTIDSCNTTTGLCAHANKAPNTVCSDGDPCTQGDTCIVPQGQTLMVCTPGAARDCNDGNVCTIDSCDAAGNCIHRNQDGITCDDGNACRTNDQCIDGTCSGASELTCDDNNPCTTDTCDPAVGCVNTPKPVGSTCSDANPCTINDSCQNQAGALRCVGTTKNCDDNNTCTADFCGASGICQYTNLTGSCSDGNACTSGDSCQNGVCVGGSPVNCNDNNPCTTDACNPTGDPGAPCTHAPRAVGTTCSDGDPCTLSDVCTDVAGTILCRGSANNCNDNNICTEDICQADGSCGHTNLSNIPCIDGNECTTTDTCQAGVCTGGAAPNCNDGNSCTVDTCNGTIPGGCVHTEQPNNSLCNDGNVCTDGDKCQPGGGGTMQCLGTPVNCDDGNPCTQDSCDPVAGCLHTNSPNGQSCNDSNACTTATTCTNGVCGGGTSATCNDNNACTSDTCDATSGLCVFVNRPTGTSCTDGNPCTVGDRCVSGTCTPTANGNENGVCDDANACTVTDRCVSGTCTGSGALDCNDNQSCTQDICAPESGCTHTNLAEGVTCDDGSACTTGTTCALGVCTGGSTVHCNDGKQCTSDACVPATGCVYTNLTAGTTCSDANACTDGDACDGGGNCTPGLEICDVCVPADTFRCDVADDRSLQGTSVGGPTDINLYSGGTCSTATFGGREATYGVTGTAGADVEVFWSGPTGQQLPAGYSFRVLDNVNGCNPNACVADSTGAPLRFTTAPGETYYTVLDHTTVDAGGGYRVHTRCINSASCVATVGCDGVSRCGMSGQVSQMGDVGTPYATTCTGGTTRHFPGPDRIIQFTAPATGDVMVYLTDGPGPPNYFAFVIPVGQGGTCDNALPSACTVSSCCDPETGGSKPYFSFAATGDWVYCIVIDSENPAQVEEFVMSVGCY